MITDLKIKNIRTKKSQIAEFIRGKILLGSFKEGMTLPSTQALAKEWQMPKTTIHRALSMLVKEGLLMRKPKIGTIVNPRNNKISVIAIYVKHDIMYPSSDFLRLLIQFIENELKSRKIECRIFIENKEKSSLQQLNDMTEKRLIQGIIAPFINTELYANIKCLPVPFSCIASTKIRNRVPNFDKSFIDNAIVAFKKMNCKKISMITGVFDFVNPTSSSEQEQHNFHNYFHEQLKKNGMTTRKEWIHTPDSKAHFTSSDYNHFAFNGLYKIWNNKEKPDGLFVFTEDMINGILLAILAKKIKVPDELKLVLHHNAENDILCPVPCFFVEKSIRKMAIDLIDLVIDQFDGKDVIEKKQNSTLREHYYEELNGGK